MALGSWRAALEGVRENPLAEAFELTRRRRLAKVPALRRFGLASAAVLLIGGGVLYILLSGHMGAVPAPAEWPWVVLSLIGVPLYAIWLLRSVYEVALLSLQLLGRSGRRAAHLQIDDMLALTPLTSAELVLGTAWSVVRPLLPMVVCGALLVWALGLGNALNFGSQGSQIHSDSVFTVLLAAPLTMLCIAVSSALTLSVLSLWWVTLGRGLKADQLSVGGALVYGLLQTGWTFGCLALIKESGGFQYTYTTPYNQTVLTTLAGLVVVASVFVLLLGTEHLPTFRAGLAAVGPLLPLLIGFAFVVSILSAMETTWNLDIYGYQFMDQFMPDMALGWSGLMPLNPLAMPHPTLLGYLAPDSSYDHAVIWPSPLHFAALLLIQVALLAVCWRFALRSVELHRRAL